MRSIKVVLFMLIVFSFTLFSEGLDSRYSKIEHLYKQIDNIDIKIAYARHYSLDVGLLNITKRDMIKTRQSLILRNEYHTIKAGSELKTSGILLIVGYGVSIAGLLFAMNSSPENTTRITVTSSAISGVLSISGIVYLIKSGSTLEGYLR